MNPNRTTSPVTLRRFPVRGQTFGARKPSSRLKLSIRCVYAQDVWGSRTTFHDLRAPCRRALFGETGFVNPIANGFHQGRDGAAVQYSTDKLPDPNILWSPRVGFNWAPMRGKLQVRGGSGVFSGRPAYVWISNQIGNNGILTGFEQIENTTTRPWHPDPNRYKPTTITGAPRSYGLALSDLRSGSLSFGVRRSQLITGCVVWVAEQSSLSRDLNGVYTYANLSDRILPSRAITGRGGPVRTVSPQLTRRCPEEPDIGRSWNWAATLEKPFRTDYRQAAYSFGKAENTLIRDRSPLVRGTTTNTRAIRTIRVWVTARRRRNIVCSSPQPIARSTSSSEPPRYQRSGSREAVPMQAMCLAAI